MSNISIEILDYSGMTSSGGGGGGGGGGSANLNDGFQFQTTLLYNTMVLIFSPHLPLIQVI